MSAFEAFEERRRKRQLSVARSTNVSSDAVARSVDAAESQLRAVRHAQLSATTAAQQERDESTAATTNNNNNNSHSRVRAPGDAAMNASRWSIRDLSAEQRRLRRVPRGVDASQLGGIDKGRITMSVGLPAFDLAQQFLDSAERPENFVVQAERRAHWRHFPHVERLMLLKDAHLRRWLTPPMYWRVDLVLERAEVVRRCSELQFETILVDPPWAEYAARAPGAGLRVLSLAELKLVPVAELSSPQCFLWLWCGESHRDDARELMRHWGFRAIDDVVWLKRGVGAAPGPAPREQQVFLRVKEHCIVGVKGDVRGQRSSLEHMVHGRLDSDVLVDDEPPQPTSTRKPAQVYDIIEAFCTSRRRLELFGEDHCIRAGWVTFGDRISTSHFDAAAFNAALSQNGGSILLPPSNDIEALRPKSPPPR